MCKGGRLAVDYRSVRTRALRWIGFSEDDAKNQRPRGANIRRQSRIRVANALKTTRSTFVLRWTGFSEDDAKTNRRMRKIFCALPAKRCSISNLGGKAASVCQRVEDNAFHLRALSERWIGFSEDDAKIRMTRASKKSLKMLDTPQRF
jgi:hypothetical protein